MANARATSVDRYLYRVQDDVARRRPRVRCYLVERPAGTNVVARIVFLGALEAASTVSVSATARARGGASRGALGRWRLTPSARHARTLVTPAVVHELLWPGR